MAIEATRSRTVIKVILPTAVGGIVTATIVAVARAAGETAPCSSPHRSSAARSRRSEPADGLAPAQHLRELRAAEKALQEQAWAAALVLITIVLMGSLVGRLLSLRTRPRSNKCGSMVR